MNKLLATAYEELEKLKESAPSWETYTRINALSASIAYLEKHIAYEATEIGDVIDEMAANIGEKRTLEKVKNILNDFKKDLDCVSPQLSNCLIKKIKESR